MATRERDRAFYERMARHAQVRFVSLEHAEGQPDPVDHRAAGLLSAATARSYGVVPVGFDERRLVVAVAEPLRSDAVAALGLESGREVEGVLAPQDEIDAARARLYGGDPPAHRPAERVAPPAGRDEARRYRDLARRAGLDFRSLALEEGGEDPVEHAAARMLSPEICRSFNVVPVSWRDGVLTLATADPFVDGLVPAVNASSGRRPRLVVAPPSEIAAAVVRVFGEPAPAPAAPSPAAPAPAPAPPAPAPRAPDAAEAEAAELGLPFAPARPEEVVVPARRLVGELLLGRGLVTRDELDEALALQERIGDRLGEVLVHGGVVREAELAKVLADQLRLTFTDLSSFEPEDDVVELIPRELAEERQVVPLMVADGALYVAMGDAMDADALAAVAEHSELPVRAVVASAGEVESLLVRLYASETVSDATRKLLTNRPEDSAHYVLSRGQRIFFLAALAIGAICVAIAPITAIVAFNLVAVTFYISFSLYRFSLMYRALSHHLELPVTDEEVLALDERTLPTYTLLIPLHREAEVVGRLARFLDGLDYPPTKLDIKLLLEADDTETIDAVRALDLPPHYKVMVVPDSQPKTKPKACNYGLAHARGKYIVIYDAEDEPEPDQLKKIVVAFSKSEERVVCIQCKLNYFNRDQNLLTRWFTTEYSMWFDLFMPGLDATDAPIPLGGTSNHFVTETLVEVGGWDPFNVTEDADLGIRVHKLGYRTAMVDSTTFEEANSEIYNWIRQRSRWVKGYIQTWLVQMRHPLQLAHELGWRRWLSFQFTVGGTFAIFLLNPIYWLLTSVWLATESGLIRSLFPSFLYYTAAIGLHLGNFVFAYVTAAGASRRGYHGLVKYALLAPLYWALMSVGAWKGFLQLFTKPFYWEKTEHGLDIRQQQRQAERAEARRQ